MFFRHPGMAKKSSNFESENGFKCVRGRSKSSERATAGHRIGGRTSRAAPDAKESPRKAAKWRKVFVEVSAEIRPKSECTSEAAARLSSQLESS